MYVCMYVCMCLFIYLFMSLIYSSIVYLFICLRTYIYIYTYTYKDSRGRGVCIIIDVWFTIYDRLSISSVHCTVYAFDGMTRPHLLGAPLPLWLWPRPHSLHPEVSPAFDGSKGLGIAQHRKGMVSGMVSNKRKTTNLGLFENWLWCP